MKLRSSSSLSVLLLGIVLLINQISFASQGSVTDRILAADEPFDASQIESTHPISDQAVWSKETSQGNEFKVLARKNHIERYRCSACHVIEKKVLVSNGALLTHGDIAMNHGREENNLTCVDCHHVQDRDALVDKQGEKIDFDHSYQLCGQCHFRQKRDWIGGAHGKRVTYWAGGRVIRNCTTCHDPHAPRFKKRMPATYSLPLDTRGI